MDRLLLLLRRHLPLRVNEKRSLSVEYVSIVLSMGLSLLLREPTVRGIWVVLSVHGRVLMGIQRQLPESLLKRLLAEHV